MTTTIAILFTGACTQQEAEAAAQRLAEWVQRHGDADGAAAAMDSAENMQTDAASGKQGAAALKLPYCAASLAPLCGADAWRCGACDRRYHLPLALGPDGRLRQPHCLACGVRVARAALAHTLAEVGL